MKRKTRWSTLIAFLLAAVLLPLCFPVQSQAYGTIDTSREASLEVIFGKEETGFSGVGFQLYRVADVSEKGGFALTEDFSAYSISLEGLDSSGWRALAQTLDAYIARDGIKAVQAARTGKDGKVRFQALPVGLYLVSGGRFQQGDTMYTPEPFLFSLPTQDEETGQWTYNGEVSCKYESEDAGETVERKVLKTWKNEENSRQRPEKITVQLLKDEKVYDTVTLSEENNWRYTWRGLDATARWRVMEYKTPTGYNVSVNQQGITFVMTNTWDSGGDTPGSPTPGGGTEKLPQTGMLWWPVPLLACGGLLLVLLGWRKRRDEGQQ